MSTDTLTYVLSSLKRAAENAYPWSLTPNEAGLLVAEIERLRDQRRLDNAEAAQVYDFARDKGKALERAAVVAWLRGGAGLRGGEPAEEWDDLWVAARDIERGEHRREGEQP